MEPRRMLKSCSFLQDAGHGLAESRADVARACVAGAGGCARAVSVGATGRTDSCTGGGGLAPFPRAFGYLGCHCRSNAGSRCRRRGPCGGGDPAPGGIRVGGYPSGPLQPDAKDAADGRSRSHDPDAGFLWAIAARFLSPAAGTAALEGAAGRAASERTGHGSGSTQGTAEPGFGDEVQEHDQRGTSPSRGYLPPEGTAEPGFRDEVQEHDQRGTSPPRGYLPPEGTPELGFCEEVQQRDQRGISRPGAYLPPDQ